MCTSCEVLARNTWMPCSKRNKQNSFQSFFLHFLLVLVAAHAVVSSHTKSLMTPRINATCIQYISMMCWWRWNERATTSPISNTSTTPYTNRCLFLYSAHLLQRKGICPFTFIVWIAAHIALLVNYTANVLKDEHYLCR